jgi:general secretion pathway protein E
MVDLSTRVLEAAKRLMAASTSASPSPGVAAADAPLPERVNGTPILDVIRKAGFDDAASARCVGEALGIPMITNLAERRASATFLEKVPIAFARQHKMIGLASDNGHLPVAIAGIDALPQLRVLSRFLGVPVRPVLSSERDIAAAINAAYQARTGAAQTFIERLDRSEVLGELDTLNGHEDLLDVGGRAPVIKLVNLVLFEAVQARASDVHVQPYEDSLVVRMRIDGVLYDSFTVPKHLQDEIVSRLKVMGRMNIAEKRLAQDGRATVQVGDRAIDLRIATLPTNFGERVVIRLLDKSCRLYSLAELGMEPHTMRAFRELIGVEHGLILVTGPTGSGKSTTLYAALQQLNGKEKNILTLEDPIEFRLEGISQTQVSEKKGMTFASGLRSVLRQDPDVIMVGEIRDKETAVMAIQSALTGHLVFSTLHTNDAASAVARMLDLGIEPYLLASSVVGVLAQRLVRQVCPNCARPLASPRDQFARLGVMDDGDGTTFREGAGCAACRQTGYSGRVGIFELLVVDETVRQRIQARATAADIKATAAAGGMRTLRDDGVAKVLAGTTTVDEVLRVTMRTQV